MHKALQDTKILSGNVPMPTVGLGLYRADPGKNQAYNAVRWALDIGYRHLDTAALYNNEAEVGRALQDSGVDRGSVFVTTKLWPLDFTRTRKALEGSLNKLRTDWVDGYLMHWPGTDTNARFAAWEDMLLLQQEGKIRCPGVSNFLPHHLEELIGRFGTAPAMNQIELHPWRQQRDNVACCAAKGIQIVSWGPIFHGHLAEEPLMAKIGEKHSVSPAQAALRWHLQKGYAIIPKSINRERILENAKLSGFKLDAEDMRQIDALDGKRRFAFDEDTFDGIV